MREAQIYNKKYKKTVKITLGRGGVLPFNWGVFTLPIGGV